MKNTLLTLFACLSLPLLRAQDPYYAPPFTILSSEYLVHKSNMFADQWKFENKQIHKDGTIHLNFTAYGRIGSNPSCSRGLNSEIEEYFQMVADPGYANPLDFQCMPMTDSTKFAIGTYFKKPNGDVMYIGYSRRDILPQITFELRDNNNQLKSYKAIGGYHNEKPFRIRESIDGGYIGVANYTGTGDGDIGMGNDIKCGDALSYDIWLFKTDSVGNVQRSMVFGGPYEDAFGDIHVDEQGNVMVFLMITGGELNCTLQSCRSSETGWAEGSVELLGLKLDKDLNILWSRCYGGSGVEGWRGNVRMVPDGSGGYYVATRTSSSDGMLAAHPWNGIPERKENNPGIGSDLWLFRIDTDGNILKTNSIPFERAEVTDIALSKDGTIWVGIKSIQGYGGLTLNESYGGIDAMVLHLDANLNLLHKRYLGGGNRSVIHSITALEDSSVLIALEDRSSIDFKPKQYRPPFDNENRYSVVFFRANGKTDTMSDNLPGTGHYKVFPNPTLEMLNIEIPVPGDYHVYIYTMDGRKAGAFAFNGLVHKENIAYLQPGIYTILLTKDGNTLKTFKLAKQ